MTLEELAAHIRGARIVFLSIAPAPGGGWQASIRASQASGFNTHVTKPDETLETAIRRVIPGLYATTITPAADTSIFD
jgi:hypothetical protein